MQTTDTQMLKTKKVFIESYGCQMNEYDSELVRAILKKENYTFVPSEDEADIIMLNTCAPADLIGADI